MKHLVHIQRRQGAEPHRHVVQQLGLDAAGPTNHHRAEDGIPNDSDQHLDAALDHRLDEQSLPAHTRATQSLVDPGGGVGYLLAAGQAQPHRAEIGLVDYLGADRFQRHPAADLGGGVGRGL